MRHHPVIAFVVPYPFEILDLTGPVSVFEQPHFMESAIIRLDLVHPIERRCQNRRGNGHWRHLQIL